MSLTRIEIDVCLCLWISREIAMFLPQSKDEIDAAAKIPRSSSSLAQIPVINTEMSGKSNCAYKNLPAWNW